MRRLTKSHGTFGHGARRGGSRRTHHRPRCQHPIAWRARQEVEQQAKRRIAQRDHDNWPVLTLAMALNAPVWTEDADFFGAGVATRTTRNVETYLGES